MKKINLTDMNKEDLNHSLADLNARLLKLNFDMAENKVKDVSQVKKVKRDIARVKTKLKQLN
jgi:large subunit ribosomal protein L29